MNSSLPTLPEVQHRLLNAYDHEVEARYLKQLGHSDSAYTTWFIRAGGVRIFSDGKQIEASRDQWVFFDPFRVRSLTFDPRTNLLSIRVQIEWKGVFSLPPHLPVFTLPSAGNRALLNAGTALVEALTENSRFEPDLSRECATQALFFQWLSLWHHRRSRSGHIQPAPVEDLRISQILAFLSEHPGLGVVPYGGIEERVRLSRSQVDRLFKKHLNLTPRQWCEQRTLALAQHWLSTSNRPIKEIAYRLRFVDTSHFARWFKQQTGSRPGEAR